MALSQETLDHLLEAEGSLRASLRYASTNENPLVIKQISQLLLDIEHCKEFEKLRDYMDKNVKSD